MTILHKAFLICFAWLSFAALPAVAADATRDEAQSTRFDGVYEITVHRVWRDDYWQNRDNPHYAPGKTELLHSAQIEIDNGEVIFSGLTKTVATAGPAFDDFQGHLSDRGVLSFTTQVNLLRGAGKEAPRDLAVSAGLRQPSRFDQTVAARPEEFDQKWDAYVTIRSVGAPDKIQSKKAVNGNS